VFVHQHLSQSLPMQINLLPRVIHGTEILFILGFPFLFLAETKRTSLSIYQTKSHRLFFGIALP